MTLTLEDLDHIEELAQAASEGPWFVDPLDIGTQFNIDMPDGFSVATSNQIAGDHKNEQRIANTKYIAGLNPEVVLAMVRQLKASLPRT